MRFLSTAVHENISVERISSVRPEYGKKALFKALCTCTIHPPLPTSGSPLPISFLIASFLFSGSWLLVVEQLSTTSVNQLAANHHRKMACLMDLASSKNFEKNNPCCLASCSKGKKNQGLNDVLKTSRHPVHVMEMGRKNTKKIS